MQPDHPGVPRGISNHPSREATRDRSGAKTEITVPAMKMQEEIPAVKMREIPPAMTTGEILLTTKASPRPPDMKAEETITAQKTKGAVPATIIPAAKMKDTFRAEKTEEIISAVIMKETVPGTRAQDTVPAGKGRDMAPNPNPAEPFPAARPMLPELSLIHIFRLFARRQNLRFFYVRLAAHVSQGCKSQVCPVVGKT